MLNPQPRRNLIIRFAVWIAAIVALSSPAFAQPKEAFWNSGDTPAAPIARGIPEPTVGYRIGPGDVLAIVVRKEPDASADSVVVRSDGAITVPILKEVAASGLSPSELEKTLTEQYARFIREPDVTVVVKEIHSEKVFVVGAVRNEGPVSVSTPLTALQAIAAAGGLTDYAKKSKITILRVQDGKQVRIPFDYSAVVKGSAPDRNIYLNPGDTIIVP
jgi:polysaccharide export outer membrane protein